MIRLFDCRTVVQVGDWVAERGITPWQGPGKWGPVGSHSQESLHYHGQALDCNWYGADPLDHDWADEHDALVWLFNRVLSYKKKNPNWPLDEMFHRNLGFRKESGVNANVPITGHDNHLHIGFTTAMPPGGSVVRT